MSNTFSDTISDNSCCPQTTSGDFTKYYKIAVLVLGFTFCLATTAGRLFVARAIETSHSHLDRTGDDEGVDARTNKGRLLGLKRSSFRRTLRKTCRQGAVIGVTTVLAALAGVPPTINLAELTLPAPATACNHHRT
ncbi:hypothetical protein K466DRAFT_583236 [Polyporus arcularius HHB13444]|uniref:Uncharacterized protein n=1 Tax=Polyporus arcularius HHB13444 TaxID=1314778 RepID=A0A5C3PRK3_9APHY|nr:hypothetical protein K466DRAFT_583236 [Polyporus arcularius HHB13444]